MNRELFIDPVENAFVGSTWAVIHSELQILDLCCSR